MPIRLFRKSDAKKVRDLLVDWRADMKSKDPLNLIKADGSYCAYFLRIFFRIGKSHTVFVAEHRKQVMGFIAALIETQKKSEKQGYYPYIGGRIYFLFVKKEFRNKGIGQKLLAAVEKQLVSRGATHLYVDIFVPNKRSHEFYRRKGYADRVIDMVKKV